MAVELEWRFGDEVPEEAPPPERRPPRPRRRVRLGFGVAAALVVAGVVLYACWRVRSETLVSVEGEVQAVAELELRALEEGDTDLYLSLQDDADPAWREAQETQAWLNALVPPPLPGLTAMTVISIENARVVGDAARVELAGRAGVPEGEVAPFRAVRFYRRSDDGRWLHTRADPDYAGHTVVFAGEWVVVTAFAADADLARRAALDLEELAVQTCGAGPCPERAPVTLVFTGTLAAALDPAGVLPAPFLVGVPDNEAAEAMWQARLRELLLDRLAANE